MRVQQRRALLQIAGTIFEGQTMLKLGTHCQNDREFDQSHDAHTRVIHARFPYSRFVFKSASCSSMNVLMSSAIASSFTHCSL